MTKKNLKVTKLIYKIEVMRRYIILIFGHSETAKKNWIKAIAGNIFVTDENSRGNSFIKGLKLYRFEVNAEEYTILDVSEPDNNDLMLTKKGIN